MDPVELARRLIAFDTVNPPGDVSACAGHLAALLQDGGWRVARHEGAPGWVNLVARLNGRDATALPLVLTGHLDTVPLGARPWSVDPFAGEIRDGRLSGRGSSDMKGGVAAIVAAALDLARETPFARGVALVLTAGEETGSEGARHLATIGALGRASALIVAEPTGNRPVFGHKGALHLTARTRGVTAHGSMPELGVNAVYRAARAVVALAAYEFRRDPHPVLGRPTLSVGSIAGGANVNSVPDACAFTIDIRTVPGMAHAEVLADLQARLGPEVAFDPPMVDLGAVATAPDAPFASLVREAAAAVIGAEAVATAPAAMPYFTDASVLQPAYGDCSTVILGPGEAAQAHQTDESCPVESIRQAAAIYARIARAWCA